MNYYYHIIMVYIYYHNKYTYSIKFFYKVLFSYTQCFQQQKINVCLKLGVHSSVGPWQLLLSAVACPVKIAKVYTTMLHMSNLLHCIYSD